MDHSILPPLADHRPTRDRRATVPAYPVALLTRAEAEAARVGAIEGVTLPSGPRLQRGWAAALFAMLLTLAPGLHARAQEVSPSEDVATVSAATVTTVRDPFERMNRATFKFNNGADRYVMRPVVRGYTFVTPKVVRNRVGAVLGNLGEPFTAVNDVLQVRGRDAGRATSRFLINSTLGGLGLFDVASRLGVEGHESDFGQTLGRYGVGSGPYVVFPFLGPSTVRDGVGGVVEFIADPVSIATAGVSNFGLIHATTEVIDGRASAEPMIQALQKAADPYATVRSAYAQNRASVVRTARGEREVMADFEASQER